MEELVAMKFRWIAIFFASEFQTRWSNHLFDDYHYGYHQLNDFSSFKCPSTIQIRACQFYYFQKLTEYIWWKWSLLTYPIYFIDNLFIDRTPLLRVPQVFFPLQTVKYTITWYSKKLKTRSNTPGQYSKKFEHDFDVRT